MIFKTYDSDIDGITNKLGFSQRSFAEWGEQVSKSFSESEGVINKFKNTMNAVFVPQTGKNDALIGDFQAFKDLMDETGLSAEDLAKEVGNVDSRIVNYAKSTDASKLSTDGFKNSIGELSVGAKAGKIALQGLALVGNALAMAFASWVATEIISWLNDLAHAEENARKRSEELTSSYETEKKNIDDNIAKYKELSKKLDDNSLSTSEVKSIKEQLLDIQDQLNEKYGAEATQIDLVNGKYDEQIKKLDALAKKKAKDYVAENYNDIKADEKYVSEKFNVDKSLGFKGSQANPDDYSGAGFDLKKYLDRYDKLDAKVVNPDGQYGMIGTVNLVTSGTRQEVYDQITDLFNDLSKDFGESNEGVNNFKSALNDILKDSFDTDELANANSRIKKYAEAEILSNDKASKSYNDLVDAVDNYNTALETGKGVDEAKQKLLETKQAAEDSTKDITNSGKVLQDVYDSLSNEAPIEFQVEVGKNVDDDLQKSYDDAISSAKEKYGEDLTPFFEENSINTQEEIDKWNEVAASCDNATEAKEKYLETPVSDETPIFKDIFGLNNSDKELTELGKINEELDKFQSAYTTLKETMDSYNETGTFTLDQVQGIISLGDVYLKYLMDENGELQLNEEALNNVATARINEMRVKAISNLMDNIENIKNEGDALKYLENQNLQTAASYGELTKKRLEAWNAEHIDDISEKTRRRVIKYAEEQSRAINEMFDKIDVSSVYTKSSSAAKSATQDAEKSIKELIESYMTYMEKSLETGRIDYNAYCNSVKNYLSDMYKSGKISAKDYFDYQEKMLNNQKSFYDKALSAITKRLDKEIDKWQEKIDALNKQNDLLNEQKDNYDKILSVVSEVYDKEIERINEQKDALQDQIDALNDKNDTLDLQYRKEQALYALEQSQRNRNRKLYVEGRGYIYDTDQTAIRDAQKDLSDIENEEIINSLQKEQESLDKSIELLEKYKQLWADISTARENELNRQLIIAQLGSEYESIILQNRTSDIENFKENYISIQRQIEDNTTLIESYEEKVSYYEQLKSQWQSITDEYETQLAEQYAAQLLGAKWEEDVINGRIETLNQFRNEYIKIQQDLADAAWNSANEQIKAAQEAAKAANGTTGSANTIGNSDVKYEIVNSKTGKVYEDNFSTEKEASDYFTKNIADKVKGGLQNNIIIRKYHTGLKNGLVNHGSFDEDFKRVQDVGVNGLKRDEVPAILREGEAVVTKEQTSNIADALNLIPRDISLLDGVKNIINNMPVPAMSFKNYIPDFKKSTNIQPVNITQDISISLPNVTNTSGYESLVKFMNSVYADSIQYANRRK